MSQQGGNGVSEGTQQGSNGVPQREDPLIGQVIDARYRIESVLGEGGMGIVYRATHTALNKPLAIKVLRPEVSKNEEIVARFKQEAQSASAIGNQHIIDISDFGVLGDGSTYFVMEFLDGQSLTAALENETFTTERTVRIAKQLCSALGAAHERGIVHRDMKPDNVQLIPRGGHNDFVKVLDFGIAKVGGSNSKLTQAGQVFGTPHYMSPEQCAGANVDQRTDIYAVGVILYEMGTGQVPFDADNLMGILTKHLYENPIAPHDLPPPANVPAALEAVILKCLAKKPEQRYQTMAELAADLDAVTGGTTPKAVVDQVTRQSQSTTQRDLFNTDDGHGRVTLGVGQPKIPTRSKLPVLIGLIVLAAGVAGVMALSGGEAPEGEASGEANVVAPAGTQEPDPAGTDPSGQPAAPDETGTEEVAAPEPAPEPEPEPEPELAKMTLKSSPAGAEVYRDGDLVGATPFDLFKPTGKEPTRFVLKLDGYEDKSVLVRALSPDTLSVRLTREKKKRTTPKPRQTKPTSTKPKAEPDKPAPTKKPAGRLQSEVLDPWD